MLTSSGRAQRGAERGVVLVELVQRLLEAGAGQRALVLRDAGGVAELGQLLRGLGRVVVKLARRGGAVARGHGRRLQRAGKAGEVAGSPGVPRFGARQVLAGLLRAFPAVQLIDQRVVRVAHLVDRVVGGNGGACGRDKDRDQEGIPDVKNRAETDEPAEQLLGARSENQPPVLWLPGGLRNAVADRGAVAPWGFDAGRGGESAWGLVTAWGAESARGLVTAWGAESARGLVAARRAVAGGDVTSAVAVGWRHRRAGRHGWAIPEESRWVRRGEHVQVAVDAQQVPDYRR